MVKNPLGNADDIRVMGSIPLLVRCPGGGNGNLNSSIFAGESDGKRSLASYSPQGLKESDGTEAT